MEDDNQAIRATGGGGYAFVRKCEGLHSLLKDKVLCDVKLKTDDGTIVYGHKVVLASASQYFRSMFTNGFKESNKDHVVIKELNSMALQLLVDSIYTAQILVTEDNVQVLLHAAHFLLINDVRDACFHFLKTKLRPTTCLGIRELADLYGCVESLSCSESYIQQHFSKVVLSDEFLLLSFEQVIKLISIEELTCPSEETVFDCIICWVNHDLESRKDTLPELMQHIRVPLLSAEYLKKKVEEEEPLFKHSFECQNYINEALHLPSITKSVHTMPRRYTGQLGILVVGGRDCSIEWYDFTTYQWHAWIDDDIRFYAGLALLEDRWLFQIGGRGDALDEDEIHTIDKLDLCSRSSSWMTSIKILLSEIPLDLAVAVIDNCIYAVGW